MAVKGGTTLVKYLLFGFNIVFWLAGTGVFIIGLWLRFNNQTKTIFEQEGQEHSLFYMAVLMLIITGALMLVIGFLGCCGAIRESPCMLAVFFAFLLAIFVTEIGCGIWAFQSKDEIISELKTFYKDTYTDCLATGEEYLKEILKQLQEELSCCGLNGSVEGSIAGTCPTQESTTSAKPCPEAIEEMFSSRCKLVGAVGIGIAVIMIFGMVFSMMLCCAVEKK